MFASEPFESTVTRRIPYSALLRLKILAMALETA